MIEKFWGSRKRSEPRVIYCLLNISLPHSFLLSPNDLTEDSIMLETRALFLVYPLSKLLFFLLIVLWENYSEFSWMSWGSSPEILRGQLFVSHLLLLFENGQFVVIQWTCHCCCFPTCTNVMGPNGNKSWQDFPKNNLELQWPCWSTWDT